ncbi:hypothetical protein GGE50_005998 [Rhizobium leguminosarum]|nr:hypothetical protein [Rhizobium leguminosarum]MBB4345476.1 hypothetical protein [Rhizobium leguminosarum]MBB4357136.1 hypothetical protein [Rhizobium leguminosarum]MBB4389431.1 hypothetical protein [Rhizobium leguminosarum]MBB4470043.1 hypothetical protein [Rhizobium leguminosarum]
MPDRTLPWRFRRLRSAAERAHAAVGLARISSDEELSAEILVTVRDFVAGIDK